MEKIYLTRNEVKTSPDVISKIVRHFKNLIAILLLSIGYQNIYSQTTYTSGSGTFTVPCDVTSITVQIWGGGGAGGAADANPNGGSGGGAGGYSTATLTVTPGATYAYTVGTGGTGGSNNGGNGSVTTFGTMTANGGTGGGENQGAIGTGGTASGGTTNTTGGNGGLGTTALGAAGGNAAGGGGTGGAARTGSSNNGNAGSIPGGGGGGGLRISGGGGRTGGDGARGEIRITYTSALPTYCSATFTNNVEPITNVTFAGINNTTSATTGGTSYLESFCSTASVQQGQTVAISVKGNTDGNFTDYIRLYVDWNKNGTFGDVANEIYDLGTIVNSTGTDAVVLSTSILVPATATVGLTRMRVMKRFNGYSTGPCQTGAGYGQAEEYSVNVTAPPPCITPTAQPSALILSSVTSSSTNGAFTAASPAPSGYLIVRSTSSTAPTLTNGTTYAVGYTGLTPGTTYVIQGSAATSNAVSFSSTGLTSNTNYYYYIFSYNDSCTGTPYYLTVSPLSGNAITCPAAPTSAVNSAITSSGFTVSWTASVAGGSAATINYTLEVYTDAGYTSPITGSPFAVGTAVTYNLTGLNGGTTYYYRIKANNGSCDSSYLTGSGATLCITPTAQPTGLVLSSVTSTSINGAFTAASPAPSGYLIVRSTSATAPALTNGTTYAVGFTGLTPGTTYVIQGSAVTSNAVSFSSTGLTGNTQYYYHIFSYNNSCTGAPYYLTTSPISNNAVTCPAAPTSPVNSSITSSGFTVSWTASAGGTAATVNYTLEVYSNAGYTTPIPGSPFSLGTGLTYNVTGLTSGTTYYYRIKANNGCDSSYLTGSASTTITNNQCSTAISIPCGTTNLAGTTVGAASFTHGSGCSMSNYGVWYTFTGNGAQNVIAVTTTSFDVEMSISSGSCGSLTNITCQDAAFSNGTETYTLNTVNGTTYYVYIADYLTGGTTTGSFTISRTCIAPLTNDECSGAISLTPVTTCSYATYSNSGATASAGIPAPGCASYTGGDVWFSAVVPATGELDVDLQTGSMTDSGMAFYSGTCGALTLLECDDDDSINGLMSNISMTGLTPGQTIYIRVWEYNNDNQGTFGICVTTPSCPSPSDLYANILSTTSVTVNWNNTTPPASGGYQYYISTTNTPPTSGTTPTGSTAAGVNGVTLTGLTPGQKYYFWVRSYCGGSDTSTWFGPTNYTPCAVGNGTGTTTLSCPSVTSGGLGLNGADPAPMSCQALGCVDLEATYLTLNQPTNYSVSSIPYSPPYQYTCLQNPVSVNIDDVWSPVINLPFNFCFYGVNYNKCLIGSNGVITFNTSGTGYTPGGYSGWSFTNNLPSTSLFLNTIFGVYHDIDPSKGGQVGWELITLNTGCRALVASWNDIPMYSSTCNSQLYTGMIVLYENTNVIEVYIKEKNVCGTWNDGNAVVGIQNAAGNAAIVAPNRNSTDTNWTVTNEAWRFTPTGTSLTTLKWYQGNGTGGPLLGTTNTINVCPTSTTTYTAEVTYALCSGTNLTYTDNVVVTVTGTKIWNGSQNTDWNTGNNWTPSGVPTNANCVIIPVTSNNPVVSASPDAVGYNLAVYNNAQLTLNASQNIVITDKVTVQPSGTFTLNNNANLVQINNTAVNTGSIIYKRIAPNIKGSDYVYWSSPVANQNIGTIYDGTFPYTSGYKYQWNTTVNNNNGAGGNIGQGNWEAASGVMTMGRGYIIRGSSSFGMPASNIPTTFTGVPFNGIIPYTVQRGSYTGAPYNGANGVQITNLNDNYNLLGNPYPSSINALKFLQTNAYNSSTNPTGQILGNVKLWTHGTDPLQGTPNPFYGSFQYNYDANDYLTINYLGSTTPGTADFIRSGQAFFVQMIDGTASSGTVNFNNSMRYDGSNNPYTNSGFFKNANIVNNEISIDRHRLWVDLVDSNSQSSGILVGYASDATNDFDNLYDAPTAIPGGMKLFSTIENRLDVYEIQGRGLPFNVNDEIPIGMNVPTQGNYSFAIAALDGLFENQNVYIKDTVLNITHDLKANPYHFAMPAGINKDRFKIVYVDNALGNHHFDENSIKVITNAEVSVSSNNLQMESIEVFNLLGQKLNQYDNINSDYIILSGLHKNNTTLLLKIKLQTGETITRKIIY